MVRDFKGRNVCDTWRTSTPWKEREELCYDIDCFVRAGISEADRHREDG